MITLICILRKQLQITPPDSSGSIWGLKAGSCGHGNKTSRHTKGEEFIP